MWHKEEIWNDSCLLYSHIDWWSLKEESWATKKKLKFVQWNLENEEVNK